MKEKAEYRVKEYNGVFIIQKKKEVNTTGFLWWKKSQIVYRNINTAGEHLTMFQENKKMMPPFKTLKEAEEMIKILTINL